MAAKTRERKTDLKAERTAKRRAKEAALLRERILAAARDLFVNEGYENFSMRKVAEKISYSPTTIYLHFRDKADLFNCLCEEMYAKLASLPAAVGERDDPVDFLRAVLRAYVELGLANQNQYRVAFLLSSRVVSKAEDYLPQDSGALYAYNLFRSAVKACVRDRKFKKVDVDAACQALWAAIHGLTSLLILFPSFPWAQSDRLIDLTIDAMINGLRYTGTSS